MILQCSVPTVNNEENAPQYSALCFKPILTSRESVMDQHQVEYPCFSIKMKPSHVLRFFMLILPGNFCKYNMPKKDKNVILVDEDGRETVARYLAKRHGLSGGWRRFVKDHELVPDDYLVFHRIATAPYKLKVEIYRNESPMTAVAEILKEMTNPEN